MNSMPAAIKFYIFLLLPVLFLGFIGIPGNSSASTDKEKSGTITANSVTALYNKLELDKLQLSPKAFSRALDGAARLKAKGALQNDSIISIIDFTLPSYKKRLFIINLNSGELLFNTFVSHGRNSGMAMATRFSNKLNSLQSSLGFYVTADTYNGQHGYSLRLQGMEKGINDNAYNRGIVMHSAGYVDESLIQSQGYIGRSWGCPAVPVSLHKEIIETIRNGSCLFIYSSNKYYTSRSRMVG
ncbi:MAG TPA: murein L,D-transpeptidase catalytic domain family protein [Chitinophagaceae bacterium]|nr:murein L,D-transpeptidase catalytic domain family protein [Chitinophagaceae bacterium]